MVRDLVLAVCKLALYDTCSSDIVKKLELVLVIFLKEIAKCANTTTAQVDLSLSVALGVAGTFKLYPHYNLFF